MPRLQSWSINQSAQRRAQSAATQSVCYNWHSRSKSSTAAATVCTRSTSKTSEKYQYQHPFLSPHHPYSSSSTHAMLYLSSAAFRTSCGHWYLPKPLPVLPFNITVHGIQESYHNPSVFLRFLRTHPLARSERHVLAISS